jgi:hypothetical protein
MMKTRTAHGPGRPPAAGPQLTGRLAFLAQFLTDADEEARRRVVGVTVGACRTGGLDKAAGVLVEVVCRGPRAQARRAAASLVEIGAAAQWPVTRRLLQSRSVQHRLRLLEILEALSPLLDRDTLIGLIQMLTLPFFRAQDRRVSEALGRLLGRLRSQLEAAAGAGGANAPLPPRNGSPLSPSAPSSNADDASS